MSEPITFKEDTPSPAPWEICWSSGKMAIHDSNGKAVARVAAIVPNEWKHPSTRNRDTGTRRANARLLAAAPELLDALRTCCLLACGVSEGYCHTEQSLIKGGKCGRKQNCHIWNAIQKARE
jgi:hypothetical protein